MVSSPGVLPYCAHCGRLGICRSSKVITRRRGDTVKKKNRVANQTSKSQKDAVDNRLGCLHGGAVSASPQKQTAGLANESVESIAEVDGQPAAHNRCSTPPFCAGGQLVPRARDGDRRRRIARSCASGKPRVVCVSVCVWLGAGWSSLFPRQGSGGDHRHEEVARSLGPLGINFLFPLIVLALLLLVLILHLVRLNLLAVVRKGHRAGS